MRTTTVLPVQSPSFRAWTTLPRASSLASGAHGVLEVHEHLVGGQPGGLAEHLRGGAGNGQARPAGTATRSDMVVLSSRVEAEPMLAGRPGGRVGRPTSTSTPVPPARAHRPVLDLRLGERSRSGTGSGAGSGATPAPASTAPRRLRRPARAPVVWRAGGGSSGTRLGRRTATPQTEGLNRSSRARLDGLSAQLRVGQRRPDVVLERAEPLGAPAGSAELRLEPGQRAREPGDTVGHRPSDPTRAAADPDVPGQIAGVRGPAFARCLEALEGRGQMPVHRLIR